MLSYATKALFGMATFANARSLPLQATAPGAGISLTKTGINSAKDAVVPYIFDMLKNLTVAEVDFDGGWFKDVEVHLPQPALSDIQILTPHATNGIELQATGVSATVSADFSYKIAFMTVTGNADIVIKKMGVDIEIDLSTQPSTPSYELAPLLKVNKSIVNINPSDIDVSLSGSFVAKIASVFIPLIKGTIIPSIVTNIEDQIKTTVDTTINQDLSVYGSQETLPYLANVVADYAQMTAGPIVTSDNIFEMAVNGTFFDSASPAPSSLSPAAFPIHNPAGKGFQGYLTQYTVNTFAEAGFKTGDVLDVSEILLKLGVPQVTTDMLEIAIPEVVAQYGSGRNVSFSGKFITTPSKAKFTKKNNQFDVNLEINVFVESTKVITADFNDIQAIFELSSSNGKIFGDVSKNSVGTLSNLKTTLTGVTAASLQAELQKVVDTETAVFNQNLTSGITIPTIMGIDIGDVELNCNDGFVEAGVNVSPALFQLIKKVMINTAEELRTIRAMNKLASINKMYLVDKAEALRMMEE